LFFQWSNGDNDYDEDSMANSVMEWVSSCPNDLDTMVERGNTDKDDDLEDSDIE